MHLCRLQKQLKIKNPLDFVRKMEKSASDKQKQYLFHLIVDFVSWLEREKYKYVCGMYVTSESCAKFNFIFNEDIFFHSFGSFWLLRVLSRN